MVSASVGYFAIKTEFIKPLVAQVPWPSPVGLGAFIGTGGDLMAALVAIICAILAFVIWFPFVKFYDGKLLKEEKIKAAELAAQA